MTPSGQRSQTRWRMNRSVAFGGHGVPILQLINFSLKALFYMGLLLVFGNSQLLPKSAARPFILVLSSQS